MTMYLVLITVVLVLIVGLILFLSNAQTKKPRQPDVDVSYLLKLFTPSNVRSVDYIRNKIVVEFVNIDFFNPEELQEAGALGISIVGDKIKFYVSNEPNHNKAIYEQLKAHLERI